MDNNDLKYVEPVDFFSDELLKEYELGPYNKEVYPHEPGILPDEESKNETGNQ